MRDELVRGYRWRRRSMTRSRCRARAAFSAFVLRADDNEPRLAMPWRRQRLPAPGNDSRDTRCQRRPSEPWPKTEMYLSVQTRGLRALPAVANTHTKLKCLLTKCAGSAFHFLRNLRDRRSGPRMRLQPACIFFRPRAPSAASRRSPRCGSFVCHRLLLIYVLSVGYSVSTIQSS
jgi:hypothetical protein